MKRKALTLTLTLALLTSVIAAHFVSLAFPNPVGWSWNSVEFNYDPLTFSSISLANKTYNVSNVYLFFSVIKPASWCNTTVGTWGPKWKGEIFAVSYDLDGKMGNSSNNIAGPDSLNEKKSLSCSANLTGLSEGTHSIVIYAYGRCYMYPEKFQQQYGWMVTGQTETLYFTVDTPPAISFLSMENQTYETTNVPLNFTVNQSVSQITYSLDGRDNVTVAGNTTLTGLPQGAHTLIVYAQDTAGNAGASEPIIFTVATALEPEQGREPFPATLVLASIASVAIVGTGLLVYFRKRNHLHQN
jgi:hypothetical protein